MPPVIVHSWRTIISPVEDVDGLYHDQVTGVFAPSTSCGIFRGGGRVWHVEEAANVPVEARCTDCVAALVPEE